ncbi:hypothetical protein DNK47_01215 [Mycoplasma wenyonii]|uniref:Uncharacterized protein n=1 Tax=Mycoplasma wenyonii TaxID=65123 RepID=A0A328PNC6_9MOLU|nr:hypothetical protein [Mycoplasma wenyonii]RAO95225.1 hypothetical protein DNK47_01215 [Mycoplasma wenyonii]
MIPFKIFAPVLIGVTGLGWVISGIVQRPAPKTIKDFVKMSSDGRCITEFIKDRDGVAPTINCQNGGGSNSCCSAGK